ncbi:MAG: topoisomerase DNA-binding C4 zinc finger domain-containing protein, partial [Clostridia bacterium]|nr:topoisomerase DNA-binding C4 zinc finger domain-containing protein [Clostridia bacterium]
GGKIYYGCTGYPQCKFLSWDIPTGEKCPKCGKGYQIRRGNQLKCSEKDCDYSAPAPKQDDEN